MDTYLTVQEVAALVRVDPMTVRRWCSAGQLGAVRLGPKVYRIARADLDAFLAKSRLAQ